jgi:molecular chaperone Hsp33
MNKQMDKCIYFNLDNNAFRGRIVRMKHTLHDIFLRNSYPQNVSAAVADTSVLGVLFASLLKYDGLFTLQIQGGGPISVLVTDVTSAGKVRSCAKYDIEAMKKAQSLRKTEGELEEAPFWLGKGVLIFTVDQGEATELYQGVVDLQGKTLADCAMRYFKNSEQIDTYLKLFKKQTSDGWETAAVLLQKMPTQGGNDAADETQIAELWNENKILLDSLKEDEIFSDALSQEDILYRLFHEHNVRVIKESEYFFGCRCSREKLLNTLSAMSEDDINEMVEDGKITATCGFCGEKYYFEKSEVLKH